MYDYVQGRLQALEDDHAVIETGGLGFRVIAPLAILHRLEGCLGQEVLLYTHLHIADPELKLFGFSTKRERQLFLMFQNVASVGPALALALVSASAHSRVLEAIAAGDPSPLMAIKGVGKKTAERLCLELKDKIAHGQFTLAPTTGPLDDVCAALVALGFSRAEAQRKARKVLDENPEERDVERLIKLVLKASSAN